MRNYFALNFVELGYNFTAPDQPADQWAYFTGVDREDCANQVLWAHQQLGFPNIVETNDQGVWYFPVDKANLSRIWNFVMAGYPLYAPIYQKEPFTDENRAQGARGLYQFSPNSPRRGWINPFGYTHDEPPSDIKPRRKRR